MELPIPTGFDRSVTATGETILWTSAWNPSVLWSWLVAIPIVLLMILVLPALIVGFLLVPLVLFALWISAPELFGDTSIELLLSEMVVRQRLWKREHVRRYAKEAIESIARVAREEAGVDDGRRYYTIEIVQGNRRRKLLRSGAQETAWLGYHLSEWLKRPLLEELKLSIELSFGAKKG